jgi:hypothetical protein
MNADIARSSGSRSLLGWRADWVSAGLLDPCSVALRRPRPRFEILVEDIGGSKAVGFGAASQKALG